MSAEPKTINEEACIWVAKINSGELGAEQRQQLQVWMRQSAAHEAELKHIARLWEDLDVLAELAVPVDVPRISTFWPHAVFTRLPAFWKWSGAGFAAVMLVLFSGLWSPFSLDQDGVYTTILGEQALVRLDDDSTMLLNTNSRVSVKFTDGARTVYLLQGEVHFDVASNPERPFRVFAGKSLSRAVGTAFSVYLQDDVVELTVTEGRVAFNSAHASTAAPDSEQSDLADTSKLMPIIQASQRARFNQLAEVVEAVETVSAPELSRQLAWQTGTLRFAGDRLEDVIAEVSRYTELSIVIVDPALRELRIGGLFKVGETQKMLRTLESSFGVHVNRIDDNIVHLSSVKSLAK